MHSCVVMPQGAYIPFCAAASVCISEDGLLSAVVAPLCELGVDGTEGWSEMSRAAFACIKERTRLHHLRCLLERCYMYYALSNYNYVYEHFSISNSYNYS